MTPTDRTNGGPAWSWEDLALIAGAALPSLAIVALLVRVVRSLLPALFTSRTITALAFQLIWYALMLGALHAIVAWRYGQPFWSSLGWTFQFRGSWICAISGPVLAILISALGVALRAPDLPNPITQMITGRGSLAMVMAFGVILAPLFEELFFRGFLFPVLARSLGAWPGIVLTAVPFALLHGSQNQWAWQQITLVGVAGVAFGYARYRTSSTAGAFLVHSTYNLMEFVGFVMTSRIPGL